MPRQNGKRPVVREGEPSQRTKQGLEIPIPKREDFDDALLTVTKRGRGKREKRT